MRALRPLRLCHLRPAVPLLRQARCFSFFACQHHELRIKQRKEAIRQKIQDLERSRRKFSSSSIQAHAHLDPPKPGEEYASQNNEQARAPANKHRLHVTFVDKDGDKHEFEVAKGDNLLDIAQANDLEMEGKQWSDQSCSILIGFLSWSANSICFMYQPHTNLNI